MAPCYYSLFSFIYLQLNSSMLFFISFLLFFSFYFPVNLLRCMTNDQGSKASPTKCTFDLDIKDPIPDDAKLTTLTSKCAIHNADSVAIMGHSDGSCYAEVSINYHTRKMSVKLTHVTWAQSFTSPYDDMFGLGKGIRSIVQYKINGNLEQQKLIMVTRIQCKTSDNCALNKLRTLMPDLTKSEPRLNIFKDVRSLLNLPPPSSGAGLSCEDSNTNGITSCSSGENRCKFHLAQGVVTQSCATKDPSEEYDIEFRFNVIEEIASDGLNSLMDAMKCIYLCQKDGCNTFENFEATGKILTSLALVKSPPPINVVPVNNTKDVKPSSLAKPVAAQNPNSNAMEIVISMRLYWIISSFLFIQLLLY